MKPLLLIILAALSITRAQCQIFIGKDWIKVVDANVYDLSKGHELWHTNRIEIERVLTNGIIVLMPLA